MLQMADDPASTRTACWDGVNLYKSDGSHMSYPVGQEVECVGVLLHQTYVINVELTRSYSNGDCPDSHPVHFVTLVSLHEASRVERPNETDTRIFQFQEFVYDVGKFPFNEDGPTWVFATGDAV